MTVLAAPFPASPSSALLADLTPDSGLALRRWTPGEFRRLFSAEIFSAGETLALVDGEIVDADSRTPRLFSRGEYYNLTNFGLLGPEERTELIYGRIVKRMSPMSRPHSLSNINTADALQDAFGGQTAVERQMPLHVERGLEPEPDVMVLRGPSAEYTDAPRPADVLLLVEVSRSTLEYDRNTKSGLYAENGIAEYWIVNLRARTLEVYRQPDAGVYSDLRVHDETEAAAGRAEHLSARRRPAADGAGVKAAPEKSGHQEI
jgi:Uma2 family endonuclease